MDILGAQIFIFLRTIDTFVCMKFCAKVLLVELLSIQLFNVNLFYKQSTYVPVCYELNDKNDQQIVCVCVFV